jgi:trehalose 6-phosphate phosphatase
VTAPALPVDPVLARRSTGRPAILLLDIDGTLAPIAPRPQDARVPEDTVAVLRRLVALPGVHVGLISGRSADDALRLAGVQGAWVIGNHGIEWRHPDGTMEVDPQVAPFVSAVRQAADRVSAIIAGLPGVMLEDKHWTLSIHYRQAPRDVPGPLRAAVEVIVGELGLRLTTGKEVLEVRPPVTVHKGTAVVALARRLLGAGQGTGTTIFIGDDVTDEDAFVALRAWSAGAVTIRVAPAHDGGAAATAAEYALDDPDAVRDYLSELARLLDS